MDLKSFINYISSNYCVEVHENKIELMPFNNMQYKIIRENDYDEHIVFKRI